MRKIAIAFGVSIIGYVGGALAGALGVHFLSTNTHDRSVEAAMTAAFVTGPAGALISLAGFLFSAPHRRGARRPPDRPE
ncbi:MAG: hypothetical protein C3F11_12365 [Methylocystaceae bacterium]|nr:MAG: hypothetical protein C3F11_12365 [Methylocystaceae bacterium]